MPSSTLLSSSEPTLKSGLRSVLHSLDLSLEDELVRYRRARRDQQRMAGSGSVGGRSDTGMTIAGGVSAGGVNAGGVNAGAATGLERLGLPLTGLGVGLGAGAGVERVDRAADPRVDRMVDRAVDRTVDRTVELAQVTLQTMAQVPTMLPKAPAPIPVVTEVPQRVATGTVATGTVSGNVAPAVAGLPQGDAVASPVVPGAAAPEQMSGLVYVGEVEEPQAAGSGMVPPEGDPSQEGYFSSSAALLDSLAEEPVATGKAAWGAIVTPTSLGVGLLLMLVSAAFGYFVLHPSALRHVPIAKLWMKEQPVVRRDAETGAIADPTPGVESQESGGVVNANPPAGPNLASKEFVDLNLGNLSGLNPQQPSIPQASLPSAATQNAGQNAAPVAIGPVLPTPGVAPGSPGASQVPLVGPGAAPGVVVGGNAPRPGLLSNLASAVAGNAALRQMNSGAPMPSVIPVPAQPGAPLPAALPATTPIGPQLPAPPAAAPVAAQQAVAPQPAPPAARPAARAAAPQPQPAARPASPRAAAPRVAPAQPVTLPPAPQIQSAPPVNVPVNVPVNAPVAAPEPTQPETPPESFGSRFTVLVPYSGEASLAQVKQLIPDAYVRETVQGPRIQVGIFNEAGSAQALVEFLRGQGLAGEVGRTE